MDSLTAFCGICLNFLSLHLHSQGLAIVLFAISVRLLLLPLSRKQSVVLALVQLPLMIATYRTLSGAARFGSPFLWLPSLASPDAWFVLPALVALVGYLQMRRSAQISGYMKAVMPAVSFAFMAALPAGLVLYYAVSGWAQLGGDAVVRKLAG